VSYFINPQVKVARRILKRYKEADQGGEDGAVGPVQPGPGIGAAQHGDLMPQHEQLRVLGSGWPAEQDQPAAEPDEDEIQQWASTSPMTT